MPQTSPRPIDLGVIAPGLGDTCDDYVRSYRHDLEKAVAAGEGGVAVSRRFARSLDGLLSALSCAANAAADSRSMAPSRVALVAVGGYGRGLVGLHSDIDVLFLCEDPDDPNLRGYAEGLLYPLWDLGLSIGHAVRGVQETLALAREDISTATTLLDLRCVSGDRKLVEELKAAAFEHVFQPSSTDFIAALAADTRARHRRYGSSVFLLEPEVKLGRGGLRDLDVTEWIAKARWGGAGLDSYVRSGALLQREAEQLESAREFLWRVRNFLHLRNSRRHDRLTFAAQEDVAEQLGFVDGITLGVEQFMQAYYRHGRVVAQTMDRMFERSVPFRRGAIDCQAMGDGTLLFGNHVTLEDSNAVSREPILAMRLYQRVLAHGRAPHRYARDSVAQAADDPDWCERLREDEEARRIFRRLLSCVPKLPVREQSMLFELHDVGLLLAMVPEFGPLTGRVQYDDYHVYTTDIHAVRAVDELRSLIAGDRKRDLPIACRLAAEAPRKDPLFLAALLHDIGTARGVGPSHRTRGAESTLEIAERLGISKVDGTEAAWLVRQNLDLFHWAMRRDTTDPEVMAAIAKEVGTEDRLRALLLFTVAVVASTNPTALSSWKAQMLEDLYLAVAAYMEQTRAGEEEPTRADLAAELRAQVLEAAPAADPDVSLAFLDVLLRSMPHRYTLSNQAEAIIGHARVVEGRPAGTVRVALFSGPAPEVAELLVVSDDRSGLLADIAAVLGARRLSVVTAQIYTRRLPSNPEMAEAVDIFSVQREAGGSVDPAVAKLVEEDLARLGEGALSTEQVVDQLDVTPAWSRRRVPEVETEVIVDNAVSSRFTVIDVFTKDRIGLLHFLSRTLHESGLSIALSKISTEGARAADVFYVDRVGDEETLRTLPTLLRKALARFHEEAEAREEAAG